MLTDPFGLIGQLLDGQYRVEAFAGEGGFSAVYRGTQVGLGAPIAIKCLKVATALAQVHSARPPPGDGPATPIMNDVVVESFVKRFRDEGRILYKLSQGNSDIVRCLASGTTTAPTTGALVPYLVLEWLDGRSLEDDLAARGGRGRSLAETLALLGPVFDAIAYAHAMGIVHRDLSMGNVFLAKTRDGDTRAKVLDFGVAKVMTDDLDIGPRTRTLAHIRIYSPAYAAPEQFDTRLGPPGTYTDVYSLALVAVEVLAGRGVRNGETLGEMMQTALDDAAPRTPRALGVAVNDAVEQVFARALSLDPARRQKDAAELSRELRGALSAGQARMDLAATARQSAPVTGPPVTQRLPRPSRAAEPSNLGTTVRLPSAPPPVVVAPPPAASSSGLFQPPAVPPPPGAPIADPSGSYGAFKTTERSALEPAGAKPREAQPIVVTMAPAAPPLPGPQTLPATARTRAAPASSSTSAQWLVGLLVFVAVLGLGAVALRLLLLNEAHGDGSARILTKMPEDVFGLVGQTIDGQFQVLEVADAGGFGVVYRAQHLAMREPIAIKCFKLKHEHSNPAVVASFTQRFFDESRIMYRLSQGNLNVVRAITTGVTKAPATGNAVPYMALEWLDGVPLAKELKERRAAKLPPPPLDEVLKTFEPAALAVAYAHEQGVVHRDLKPGNLFLQTTREGRRMKVLDFGMAKVLSPEAMGGLESAETLAGVTVLSPQYVTPEQLDKKLGAIGPWTDVYAFALILVEALTNRRARDAETFAELISQIAKGDKLPTPRRRGADVSAQVDRVFERAFARDPRARYADLGTFWRELVAASQAARLDQTIRADQTDFAAPPSVAAPRLASTMVMNARPSQPHVDLRKTMPLKTVSTVSAASPAAGAAQRPFSGTAPLVVAPSVAAARAEALDASRPLVAERSAPWTPPSSAPSPPSSAPSPPSRSSSAPVVAPPRANAVLVVALLLFVLLSLAASGLLLFSLYRRG